MNVDEATKLIREAIHAGATAGGRIIAVNPIDDEPNVLGIDIRDDEGDSALFFLSVEPA